MLTDQSRILYYCGFYHNLFEGEIPWTRWDLDFSIRVTVKRILRSVAGPSGDVGLLD